MRALCLNIRAGSLRGRASLPALSCISRSNPKLKQTVKFVVLLMYHLPSLPVNLKSDATRIQDTFNDMVKKYIDKYPPKKK
jgi:hypothetical protein